MPVLWVHGSAKKDLENGTALLRANIIIERFEYPSVNIIGKIQGTDPVLSSEYLVYSGHQDAHGIRNPIHGDSIYYGADDNQNSDPTRCGMPINPLLQESSFGCKVLCNGSSSYEMRKVRRYTEWQCMPYKEKSQYDEFQRISIMSLNAGIPKIIIDDAFRYHKKISDYDTTFRGDNRDGILAASIYISCRINNYPRTAKEIATIFFLDVASATKGCKNALVIINDIEKDMDNKEKTNLCKTTPVSFIERYCSKLGINQELTQLCKLISLKIDKMNYMPENTPNSIAAGVVYFIAQVCNLNITKRDVKNMSDTSEVTINKCFKKIEKIKDKLMPQKILNKYSSAII